MTYRTAADCIEAQRKMWEEYQKAEERILEPIINKCLEIARESLMKKNEQYLVLDFPDWWTYETYEEAYAKSKEMWEHQINRGLATLDPIIIYRANCEVYSPVNT